MNAGYQLILVKADGSLHPCEELFECEFAASMAGLAISVLPSEYSHWVVVPMEFPAGLLN